jgi:hypothetical protein
MRTIGAPPPTGNTDVEATAASSPMLHRSGELHSPSPFLVPPPHRAQADGEDRMVINHANAPPRVRARDDRALRAWTHGRHGPILRLGHTMPPKPWAGKWTNTVPPFSISFSELKLQKIRLRF